MKKVQHTPPDIPHNMENKQTGPKRKPKVLGLILRGYLPLTAFGRTCTKDSEVLEKSFKRSKLTSIKNNPFSLLSKGC